jgi:hypothetical protein
MPGQINLGLNDLFVCRLAVLPFGFEGLRRHLDHRTVLVEGHHRQCPVGITDPLQPSELARRQVFAEQHNGAQTTRAFCARHENRTPLFAITIETHAPGNGSVLARRRALPSSPLRRDRFLTSLSVTCEPGFSRARMSPPHAARGTRRHSLINCGKKRGDGATVRPIQAMSVGKPIRSGKTETRPRKSGRVQGWIRDPRAEGQGRPICLRDQTIAASTPPDRPRPKDGSITSAGPA